MKPRLLWLIPLLVLLLISLVQASQGFTVTSVTPTKNIDKGVDTSEIHWIINTQLNGGGQYITGAVTPDDVKQHTNGNAYTSKTLFVNVEAVNEQAFYEIINEGVPIYKYTVQTFNAPQFGALITGNPDPCPTGSDWDLELGKSFFQFTKKRYCITKEQVGVKGVYNNPVISFNAKLRLTVGDETKEKTICSGAVSGCDGSSISFDEWGTATWTGNLVTGDPAPNQDNFVAIKQLNSNMWQIVRKSTYEDYFPLVSTVDAQLNEFKTLFKGFSDVSAGNSHINTQLSPVNQAADELLNETTSFTSSPFTKDDNKGKVTVNLERKLSSPNIVFRIKADTLGIVIPSGQPKILEVITDKFASGESGSIDVKVQNIGDAAGAFSAILVDCNPFVQSTTSASSRKTIQPNDIDTIPISISGADISADTVKTCSVKIYDVNDPSIETYSSVTIELEEAKVCIPNKIFADGNIIKQCNEDGSSINVIENCKYGVVVDGKGGFSCATNPIIAKNYECISGNQCGETSYCNQELNVCVQRGGCINIINNGDNREKADIVFVGDEYLDNNELRKDIETIINGAFSIKPFDQNKQKFNIWMVKGKDFPAYKRTGSPNMMLALEEAAKCPFADYQVILSKKTFRSFASFNGYTALSLGSYPSFMWSGLFLHEFGHSFGKLADEYVEPSKGKRPRNPNCAPDLDTAIQWWGNIQGTDYFKGCSYVEDNYRPTKNSIMRSHWFNGDYGPVNILALLGVLNNYV